jgi:imidazolonepropionase-like amidohydrolase
MNRTYFAESVRCASPARVASPARTATPARAAAPARAATLAALALGSLVALLALGSSALVAPAFAGPEWTPATPKKFALTGGTVHTVSGAVLENATVLIDAGCITAVGAGVAAPSDATVFDCRGKHVYPGFIDANTSLGLVEIGTIEGSNDTQETGNVNPNIRAEVMVNPDSDLLPVARVNGITSALVVPGGGAIHGLSALMHLDGWTREDMTIRSAVGLHVNWPSMSPRRAFFIQQSDEEQNKARDAAIAAIRDAFTDARAYETARSAEGGAGVPAHDADVKYDAMRAVMRGEVPVFFHADALAQLHAVLAFIDEMGLKRCVIVGGSDAWRLADELKSRDIAVILGGTQAMPARRSDPYDAAFTVPAQTAAAGIRWCLSDGGGNFGAASVRNLPHHAGLAAAFGLSKEEALKSITLYPAQVLGVGDQLGSIDVGKIADLQITDGDPLEQATHCLQVFINGRPIPMENRQTRLFQKYDARPRGPKARPR